MPRQPALFLHWKSEQSRLALFPGVLTQKKRFLSILVVFFILFCFSPFISFGSVFEFSNFTQTNLQSSFSGAKDGFSYEWMQNGSTPRPDSPEEFQKKYGQTDVENLFDCPEMLNLPVLPKNLRITQTQFSVSSTPIRNESFRIDNQQINPGRKEILHKSLERFGKRIGSDLKNMHSRDSLMNFGVALMGGCVSANTKMDRNFDHWYQRRIACGFTNEFSEFTRIFGEGKIFIPIVVTSSIVYRIWQEKNGRTGERRVAGDFFSRTARGYTVGTPLLLVFQFVTGGNRPSEGASYWKPFQQDHGVSGHAYVGAVPFLTAAEMSDHFALKGLFYTLSIIPAWSRVNDRAHYLSQSFLGWYLAYLSVRAVSATENTKPLVKGLTIFPVAEQDAIGFGFIYRR